MQQNALLRRVQKNGNNEDNTQSILSLRKVRSFEATGFAGLATLSKFERVFTSCDRMRIGFETLLRLSLVNSQQISSYTAWMPKN